MILQGKRGTLLALDTGGWHLGFEEQIRVKGSGALVENAGHRFFFNK